MTAETSTHRSRTLPPRRRIFAVVLLYALFAALWIYGSDLALEHLVADAQQRATLGLFKGWAFVVVTSSVLYWLLWRMHSGTGWESPGPGFFTQLSLLAVLTIGLTASAVTLNYRLERAREVARLEAVSDLRAKQLDDWLADRTSEALFLRNSEYLSSAYLQWQDQRDAKAGSRLLERMSEFTQSNHYHGWLLLDAAALPLASEAHTDRQVPAALRDAVLRAVATGEALVVDGHFLAFEAGRDTADEDDRVGTACGEVQRAHAIAIGRRDVGTGVDEILGDLGKAAVYRAHQQRGAVGLRRVDVGALRDELLDRVPVPDEHGVEDRRGPELAGALRGIDRLGAATGGQDEQGCGNQPTPARAACRRPSVTLRYSASSFAKRGIVACRLSKSTSVP